MRLLHYDEGDELTLTNDVVDESALPVFAILSHTWVECQQVTLQELTAGTRQSKSEYQKIEYCGRQAQRDGLPYFWVVTCCMLSRTMPNTNMRSSQCFAGTRMLLSAMHISQTSLGNKI
jgi:hypothetical protein